MFSDTENGITNSFVHLGTNTETLSPGLMFDQISLTYALTNASGTSTPVFLLPYPGLAPEQYSPNNISFAAPEPTSLALLGAGLYGFWVVRRRERG